MATMKLEKGKPEGSFTTLLPSHLFSIGYGNSIMAEREQYHSLLQSAVPKIKINPN